MPADASLPNDRSLAPSGLPTKVATSSKPLVAKAAAPSALPIAQRLEAKPAEKPRPPVAKWRAWLAAVGMFCGRRKLATSSTVSAVVHCAAILLLACFVIVPPPIKRGLMLVVASASVKPPPVEQLAESTVKIKSEEGRMLESQNIPALAAKLLPKPPGGQSKRAALPELPRSEINPAVGAIGDLLTTVGGAPWGMLTGRDPETKALLLGDGATKESEEAVVRGLRWLARHQRGDGSWHFDHTFGQGCSVCANPGFQGSKAAATGMALLAFLGAGHTQMRGDYQTVVARGLGFLKGRVVKTPLGGDLQDGFNLYSQAIATLALCEAYAMSGDRSLDEPCRAAITFILNSQDKHGGGWRYFPGQVGDTSVTGWMLPALKSAQLSYIPIPSDTWKGAWRFLDHVQEDSGSAYGYQGPNRKDPTMSAVGLLGRMYQGWPRRSASLSRGVKILARYGPSQTDLYYDYYATQVLRHYGGEEWIAWNAKLRDYLVSTQIREGHEDGSWYFPDKHGDQGGRHYNTAMAVLVLEVYYRYLPIYGSPVLGDDFSK